MLPSRIEEPRKYDLEDVMKLVEMLDFLKGKLKPFSYIAYEAVRRGIIKESICLRGRFSQVTKALQEMIGGNIKFQTT